MPSAHGPRAAVGEQNTALDTVLDTALDTAPANAGRSARP